MVKQSVGEIAHKAIFLAAAGILIVALLVGGCGGSDDSGGDASSVAAATSSSGDTSDASGGGDTSGGPALTKAEFIKQGDAICEKADKSAEPDFEAFNKKYNITKKNQKVTKPQQEEMITTVVLPAIATQANELGELSVPSGEGGKAGAIVEGIEKALKEAEADPGTVVDGSSPFAKVSKQAKEYGFKVCGQ